MLYPRDPSLDPQLVWKGKDEQDQADLAVPVVPIYIQEKIHPQAIIDALPRKEQAEALLPNLFADFNGGPADFAQKIDFYHHEQNWSNRLILGDSLLVMTSLAGAGGGYDAAFLLATPLAANGVPLGDDGLGREAPLACPPPSVSQCVPR